MGSWSCGSSSSSGEAVTFGNDDNAPVRNREALRIPCPVKTDSLTCGNDDVLVDDASLELCSLLDGHAFKQERIFHHGALFHANVRKQDGVPQGTSDDQRA